MNAMATRRLVMARLQDYGPYRVLYTTKPVKVPLESGLGPEPDRPVGVVAEREVRGAAAAAEGEAGAAADDVSLLVLDLDVAAHEQRPVAHRNHGGLIRRPLAGRAVEALVLERAGRAPNHRQCNGVGVAGREIDPGTMPRIEYRRLRPDARAAVDASPGVPRHPNTFVLVDACQVRRRDVPRCLVGRSVGRRLLAHRVLAHCPG